MSKKNEQLSKLLKKIAPRASLPKPAKDHTLLEHGMLCVLVRHLPQERAEAVIATLKKAYPEWNEIRVAQTEEIASAIKGGKTSRDKLKSLWEPARELREYLQEVFQKTHGMDLEFLRDDVAGGAKMLAHMPVLGNAATSHLLFLAGGKKMPVHPSLVRVLERTALVGKGGLKKAKDLGEYLSDSDLATLERMGEVADLWCHVKTPICHECVIVDDCPFGRKTFQEWKVQQARAEAHRVREEARRAIVEKKERERRARDTARMTKKLDLERAKQEREKQRKAAIEGKRRALEQEKQKKLAEAAKKKAEAEKLAAKKKMLEAKGSARKLASGAKKSAPAAKKPARR